MDSSKDHNIPVLSFYSGGGFLDMGFEKAGFQVIWTNENDPDFASFHAAGITSWRKSMGNGVKAEIFNTKSIADISSSEIIKEAFPDGKPARFGIIGGPPCQDFSYNGKNEGFNGERGKLTEIFLNKILELEPAFFVMENVLGLLRVKSCKDHLFQLLERVRERFYLDYKILNALDFGVPQFRERVFFVGIRMDTVKEKRPSSSFLNNWFPWPGPGVYQGAFTKYKWPGLSAFGHRPKKPKSVPVELCVVKCLVPKNKMKSVPNADEYFHLHGAVKDLEKIREGETNRPSFKRLHRYKYSPTACYGNNEVHLHPYQHRRLSVRETLRIQGVPDEYVLPAGLSMTKKFKMIGNGVPVPLAEAVALSVAGFMKEHTKP